MLEVFSSSRAVRSFYNTFLNTNTLLPKAITIQELEQKSVLVPNLSLVDDDMRVLLMSEASKFSTFELLHIERNFLVFLKNSSYLFRFFEELSYEKVPIDTLMSVDTYEHYAEHLEVLQKLLEKYTKLLSEQNFYDKITLPSVYVLNEAYVKKTVGIRVHLEGFLSKFEVELLMKMAQLTPLHVKININQYNQKMVDVFAALGIFLEHDKHYEINLSDKKIVYVNDAKDIDAKVQVYGFANRLSQIAYAQSCIEQFVQEGIAPQDIVVVLPDEGFADNLRAMDRLNNLNFAMGISLRESHFYKRLSALEKVIRYDEIEDRLRASRLGLEEEFIFTCKAVWSQKIAPNDALEILKKLWLMDEKEGEESLFQEAFFRFTHFLERLVPLKFEQIVKLFLNRLNAESRDDVRGGKVTVLGVLETRGVAYKGVIVLDFNDEFVPKRSQKDLFLSSAVRAQSKLPTKRDRENLQRYYYHQLFNKASKVAISYVKSETSMPSRFLDELKFTDKKVDEKLFYPLLFDGHASKERYDVAFLEGTYDLTQTPLSATKLKTLLTCQRQFYFKYIAMLKEAKMPSSDIAESDVGRYLHKALERAFEDNTLMDEKSLCAKIEQFLKEENSHEVWEYFSDLWMERLGAFVKNEVKRFAQGYLVHAKEISLKTEFEGFVLEGQIDRIDKFGDKLFVIDYKSGKIPLIKQDALQDTADFQLEFYYLLAQQLGVVDGVFYYDLKEGKLVEESFFEEKLALLREKLEVLKKPISGFEKCEKIKECKFCPYVILCCREELV